MRNQRVLVFCILLLQPFLVPSLAQGVLDPGQSDAITAFVESKMADVRLVPGLSVAVVRGDRIVYEQGFGLRDVERKLPVTPQTVFYTASLMKAFTGMTASVLDARGQIDLDTSLRQAFPGLTLSAPLSADRITLRGLLRQAPGFTNGAINFLSSFVGRMAEADLRRALESFSVPNGGEFVYANTNYVLAAEAMERLTHRPWQKLIAETVFRDLGMSHSFLAVDSFSKSQQALPYFTNRARFELLPVSKSDTTINGAGGFFSTAHDIARFVDANLNEGRLDGRQALPAAAVFEAQRAQVMLNARFFEYDRFAYGLGLYHSNYDGKVLLHHFGATRGYRSHMSFMPEKQLGVVVLQNEGGDGSEFADVVATYIYDLLLGKTDALATATGRAAALKAKAARDQAARDGGWLGELERLKVNPLPSSLRVKLLAGVYESERLGRMRITLKAGRPWVSYGALSAELVPSGPDEFLVNWLPSDPPERFRFRSNDSQVSGLDWGNRPFSRTGR